MGSSAVLDAQKKPSAVFATPVVDSSSRLAARRQTEGNDQQPAGHDFATLSLDQARTQSCPVATPRTCPFGEACHTCPTRVQAKLEVGQPNDEYEREADEVADRVMRMPEPCSSGRPNEDETGWIRLKPRTSAPAGIEVSLQVEAQIQSLRSSGGQPLSDSERAFFEPRFGLNLRGVRVHDDAGSARVTRAMRAEALTVGGDIFCHPEQRLAGLGAGVAVLAHELTHVAQQAGPENSGWVGHEAAAKKLARSADREGDTHFGRGRSAIGKVFLQRDAAKGDDPEKALRLGKTSTPLTAKDVDVDSSSGGVRLVRGGVDIVVLPDLITDSISKGAITTCKLTPYGINWETTNDSVKSFTGPGKPKATIQTAFNKSSAATATSAYGRGTTADDVKAGRTSVGFHEGCHGSDYLEFLGTNPYPTFPGKVDMAVSDFKVDVAKYKSAVKDYFSKLDDFTAQRTDCVGTTIDKFNTTEGSKTSICKESP